MTPTTPPPIGLLLQQADSAITAAFERALGERGVDRVQWQYLHAVGHHPEGATAQDIAGAMPPGPTDGEVAAAAAEVAARGWTTDHDGRVTLTPDGVAALAELREEVAALRDASVEGVSAEDYATTIATLQRMIVNLAE